MHFHRNPGEASSLFAYIIDLLYEASQAGGAMPSCHTVTLQCSVETERPSEHLQ